MKQPQPLLCSSIRPRGTRPHVPFGAAPYGSPIWSYESPESDMPGTQASKTAVARSQDAV
jgi:hypothetical protein